MVPWCSGYHASFTLPRSPVRARPESDVFFVSFSFLLLVLLDESEAPVAAPDRCI